jgi:hypothetical protein
LKAKSLASQGGIAERAEVQIRIQDLGEKLVYKFTVNSIDQVFMIVTIQTREFL